MDSEERRSTCIDTKEGGSCVKISVVEGSFGQSEPVPEALVNEVS